MRRLLILAILLLAGIVRLAAQTPTLTPTDAIAFDYIDAQFEEYQVTSFQAQWDGGAWATVPMASFKDATTVTGSTSYKVIPPFSNGSHSVSYRACNAVGCGGGSSPFPFAYAVSSAPAAAPGNVRVVKR